MGVQWRVLETDESESQDIKQENAGFGISSQSSFQLEQ